MTIATALAEIQANDEKRKRAATANQELYKLFIVDMPKLHERLTALADDCAKFQTHVTTLIEGMAEDLDDEPLPQLNLGEK